MNAATVALLEDLRALDAVSANLTRVQARCTELLEENRVLRSDIDGLLAENVELHRDLEELRATFEMWRGARR